MGLVDRHVLRLAEDRVQVVQRPQVLVTQLVDSARCALELRPIGGLQDRRSPIPGRRVEPPCALASRCGGCPWMHVEQAVLRGYEHLPRGQKRLPLA